MFTVADRKRVRDLLLARARADEAVVGAAYTGSLATGNEDRWSDTDLVLSVRGDDVTETLERWSRWFYAELDARHHWDLSAPPAVIRVFLLPGWLELDVTFTPEANFGPRGPQWQTLFGRTRPIQPFAPPDANTLIGLLWHHALHARVCIQRERWWQAQHWIGEMRAHVVELACARLGHPTSHAKGAHLLPDELTARLEATLVTELTAPELNRALAEALSLVTAELRQSAPELATRLGPMLEELLEGQS
ncbi:hypothetical protein [Streptomyces sp. B6B3]|uniref:hypothetical protein n=1 Tax=Streptomyces sp. B6B3 TaxID=3153570 RepID=UPI00325D74D1